MRSPKSLAEGVILGLFLAAIIVLLMEPTLKPMPELVETDLGVRLVTTDVGSFLHMTVSCSKDLPTEWEQNLCLKGEYALNTTVPPKRVLNYGDMLYPAYEYLFDYSMSPGTWTWIQNKARENLKSSPWAADQVRDHWRKIAGGEIPFGWGVNKE